MFLVSEKNRMLNLSHAPDGKPGPGVCCHVDHLFTGDNLRTFLTFIEENKEPGDPDPIDTLKELLPKHAKTIDRAVEEQAKAALTSKEGPLDRGRDEFPAFDEGDEDAADA
jgi:hypothetical protein